MWTFTKEAAIAIVRTSMAYVYAWLLSFTVVADFFASFNVTQEGFVVVAGTLLYIIIRELAKHIPLIGRFLIFDTEPHYL